MQDRNCTLYITHLHPILGCMEIAGRNPLAEENAEFDKLILRNVFQASQFHKKYHITRRCLKKEILHYRQ